MSIAERINYILRGILRMLHAVFGRGSTNGKSILPYMLAPPIGLAMSSFLILFISAVSVGSPLNLEGIAIVTGAILLTGLPYAYVSMVIIVIPLRSLLKWSRFESGWVYVIAGAILTPVPIFIFGLFEPSSIAQYVDAYVFSPFGAMVALTWWLLAKKWDRADAKEKL